MKNSDQFFMIFILLSLLALVNNEVFAQPNFISKFGSSGTGNGQFDQPWGVAVDSSGNIYVSEYWNHRIQKFDSNGNHLKTIDTKGIFGYGCPNNPSSCSGDGQLNQPMGIEIDNSGNIWVVDLGNNRIQKFNSDGVFQLKFGLFGSGDGQFYSPKDIDIDSSGNIWIADTNNNRIQKFDSSGNFLIKFGSSGSGDGQFNNPQSLAIDNSGNIYVVDNNNRRVQKFNSQGTFVSKFGSYGTDDGKFINPHYIAVDSLNNIYVTDRERHNIQKFDSSGNFVWKTGSQGSGDGQFNDPKGITLDKSGKRIYVADNNNRIQVFEQQLKPVIIVTSPIGDPNTTYEGNNPDLKIFASGRVENTISGINIVSVTWKDPNGVIVYQASLTLDSNGNFNNEFDNPMYIRDMRDSGKYSAIFKYDDVVLQYDWNYLSSVYEPETEYENSTYSISIKNPRVVNKHLETVGTVSLGESVQITAEIKNESSESIDFTYHVKEEKASSKVNEAWVSGLLKPTQGHSPAVTFIPKEGGEYTITISIIQSYENQTLLAQQQKLKLVVLEPKTASQLVSLDDFTCAWKDGRISDSEYIKNIQKLLDSNDLVFSESFADYEIQEYDPNKALPSWVKSNARAYCENVIGYDVLEKALVFLVVNGYLSLEPINVSELPQIKPSIDEESSDLINKIKSRKPIEIKTDFKNDKDVSQPFAYIIQIQDKDGVTVSLSWITGQLGPQQSLNQALLWQPPIAGMYTASVFVWDDIENAQPLSMPGTITIDIPELETTEITVFTDKESYLKADIISLWGNIDGNSAIDLLIKDPNGKIVWTEKILPKENGSFSTLLIAGNPNWSQTGTYTIVVKSSNVSQETKIFYDSLSQKGETSKEACNIIDELICVDIAEGFYEEGDTIVISGKVRKVILDSPLSLQIFYDETLVQLDQLGVAQDGTFTTTLIAKGPQWAYEGTYLVRAAYLGNIAETSFEFKPAESGVTIANLFEVDAGSFGTFDVPYTISGGILKNIVIDKKILGLVVTIDARNDGTITLELTRAPIDARKNDGSDERFLVLIDGSETAYEEIKGPRTLKIEFKKGDSRIEIIGTYVVGK